MNLSDSSRVHYPILQSNGSERPLIYLDNAATALRPQCVVDTVVDALTNRFANIHRSVHSLGDLATEAYENSRQVVADFLNAQSHEIVFVRNTTEALNLVARGYKRSGRVLVSLGEHHSNLLPWQDHVHRVPPRKDGTLDVDALQQQLARGDVAVVSVAHVSNVVGVEVDVKLLAKLCHEHGAILVVDAAQSAPHQPIDVLDLDCDFLAFSGHKLGSPAGVGVLFGKAELLEQIEGQLHGGSTIEEVHADRIVPKDIPWRLEAGTPAIESILGLAAAIEFIQDLGWQAIVEHQRQLMQHALKSFAERLPELSWVGPANGTRLSLLSFVQRKVSPHLLARGLSDGHRICVRSGFQCAQPLHESLGIPASLRISFSHYNTLDEIDQTVAALERLMAIGK